MNELPPVSTKTEELLAAADHRHAQTPPSEWYQEMQAQLDDFEASGYEDLDILDLDRSAFEMKPGRVIPLDIIAEPDPEQVPLSLMGRARRLGRVVVRPFFGKKEKGEDQNHPPDVREQNYALFDETGEIGTLLQPYYEEALRQEPGLKTIEIDRDDARFPAAARSFLDGRHRAVVPMDSEAPQRLHDVLVSSPVSAAIIAERLGITPEELLARPQLIYAQATLHELGHTLQYQQFEEDPEAFHEQRREEEAAMPIPNQSGVARVMRHLEDPDSEISRWVHDNWNELQDRYGVQSTKELIELQARAKRNLFHERFADEFSARIIKSVHPNVLDFPPQERYNISQYN